MDQWRKDARKEPIIIDINSLVPAGQFASFAYLDSVRHSEATAASKKTDGYPHPFFIDTNVYKETFVKKPEPNRTM